MDIEQSIQLAEAAADDLRRRGDVEKAEAIETLLHSLRRTVPSSKDLLTRAPDGRLIAASGQQLREWAQEDGIEYFTVAGGFRLPREVVAAYVDSAGGSLDLDVLSDEEAAALVDEERRSS